MPRALIVIFLALTIWGFSSPIAYGDNSPVVVINIKGEIDGGQSALVHKALVEAKAKNARALLVEIDTFGGLVDAAVAIRDMLSDSPIDTVCYIKNRAWSAGALIAISNKKIAIAPGGSIGAAEPIPTTEKTIAAVKAEFAATANKTGRDPRVAEAMVDKTLGLPGYAEPGKILALTDYQAVKVGYADLVAANRSDVLAHYGLADAPVIEYNQGWQERMASWLSNSTVQSILLTVIFLAIMAEIKTAGMGVAASIGIVAALLYFGAQWFTGLAGWVEILLFIGGVVLIIMEIHTPGLGLFGLGGVICILASFFLSLGGDIGALNIIAGSMVVAIICFLLIVKRLPSSRLWAKLVLKDAETTNAGFISSHDYQAFMGHTGVALTLLRPAGTIEIEGEHFDAISDGQYIPAGTKVKVVSVNGSKIVVRPVNDED
jgi:membrane-bound serine protease (ClpP class)